jgi:hypothetical protein
MKREHKEMLKAVVEGRRHRKPDEIVEEVLADWAEEEGLLGLAQGLRGTPNQRWMSAASMLRLVYPDWLESGTIRHVRSLPLVLSGNGARRIDPVRVSDGRNRGD